jgi:hypothetical protein
MKTVLFALAAIAAAATVPAHAFVAGDLSFTSFNADEDGFSLVSFVNIAAGQTVYFSDNEFVSGAFNSGESYFKWTTGAVTAGQVIRFSAIDKSTRAATNGSFAQETVSGSSNTGLAASNETVYAYVGTSATAPVTFLAAITNGTFAADGPLTGTGLTIGTNNAIQLTNKIGAASATPDFADYNGSRGTFATFDDAKLALADVQNWTVDTTNGNYAATTPNLTPFTAAVPEPQTYAMMLAGLVASGFMAGRRFGR